MRTLPRLWDHDRFLTVGEGLPEFVGGLFEHSFIGGNRILCSAGVPLSQCCLARCR
jgi:hypothetical protein